MAMAKINQLCVGDGLAYLMAGKYETAAALHCRFTTNKRSPAASRAEARGRASAARSEI
jgi:hypothetical protein